MNRLSAQSLRLTVLFGVMYFVQGISEPNDGLSTQPVLKLLRSWRETPDRVAAFTALLGLPWALKPLYGLLTDFVPLFGLRRKSYLVASSAMATAGFLGLYALPGEVSSAKVLLAGLLLSTVGVAFADVVVDAMMIEYGQPLGLTGRFQAVQWTSVYVAAIGAGLLGGRLSQQGEYDTAFLICGLAAAVTLVVSVWLVREPPRSQPETSLRATLHELWAAARCRALWGVAALVFLWHFNPFSYAVLYIHMIDGLGIDEEFYGMTNSLVAIGSVIGSVGYGFYCRRVPMHWLVHLAIVLGLVSTATYWGVVDRTTAGVASLIHGVTNMTGFLILLDLTARVCPVAVAGTVFACVMALANLSSSLAIALGGQCYDGASQHWGETAAFHLVVALGAVCIAASWLVLPLLPREP